jgi:muconate cycloisomerase
MPRQSPLSIKRIEAIPVALPLIQPMTLARRRISRSLNLLVRIEARGGAVGWGEAVTMPTPGGENLRAMMRAMTSRIIPRLTGADAGRRAALVAELARSASLSRAALSAADMALLDLVGRARGLPVSELLGGRVREQVAPMWLLGGDTVEADLAEARRRYRAGYRFFKIKVGAKPLAGSIAAVNALRRAFGATVALCADANMGLSRREAAAFVRGVARSDLLYLEQPYAVHEVRALAALARSSAVPLGIDESVKGIGDIVAHHAARAAHGAAIKTITLGSLSGTVAAAKVAGALGMGVNLSAKIAESSVGAAALVHVASVIDAAGWGVSPTNGYLAEDIVRSPLAPRRGRIAVPAGGGLGVEVDAAAVRRLRVR